MKGKERIRALRTMVERILGNERIKKKKTSKNPELIYHGYHFGSTEVRNHELQSW